MSVSAEFVMAVVSFISGVTTVITAVIALRRESSKAVLDKAQQEISIEEQSTELEKTVRNETLDLYDRLSEQYSVINNKDKQMLRTVTHVIRKLIVLHNITSEMTAELEGRIDAHEDESLTIGCPFYNSMADYTLSRIRNIDKIVQETMHEVDAVLLNGNGHPK